MKSMFVQTELRLALDTVRTCVAHDRVTGFVAENLYAKIDGRHYIVLSPIGVSSWLTDLYYIQSYLQSDQTVPAQVGVLVQILIDAFTKLQSDMQSEV